MTMTTLTVKLQDDSAHKILEKYCNSWIPIKQFREDVGDLENESYLINNLSPKNLDTLLQWYRNYDPNCKTNELPKIGTAKYCEVTNDENGLPNVKTIKNKENVNPYDDNFFTKEFDPNLDNIEDINQLSCWRLKEYANKYFQDDWTREWIGRISEDKQHFFEFVADLCYLGCQVPLAIAAYRMSEIIDYIKGKGYDDTFVKTLLDPAEKQWYRELPALEKDMEDDSESDSDSDSDSE
jgi:hypothetical protein